jgi:putative ABC transport system permease protein
MNSSFLVQRNLTAYPLRSVLTALAIALGVGMVLAAAIIGQAANERAAQVSGASGPRMDLTVSSRAGAPFDADALSTLRASPDVELASPSLSVSAQISSDQSSVISLQLLGIDPAAYQALHKPELADGAFLSKDNSIVLPMSVAIRNNLRTGDEITLTQGDRAITLTVSGRLKIEEGTAQITQSQNAFVPLVVAQTLAGTPGLIDRVDVKLSVGADVNKIRAGLVQKLGADLAVVRASAEGGAAFNTLFAQAGLAMVGVIILFAAGFVIMNAFAMSITARTKEIGALRTLGMTRGQITQTVLSEAGLLALVGGVAGVLVGLGLAWVILWAMGTLDETTFNVPGWAVVLSPLMGLTITLVSALPPAWRASHVSPMEAVKPEAGTRVGWYTRHGGRAGAVALVLVVVGLSAFGFLVRPDFMVGIIALIVGMGALLAAMALLLPGLVRPVAALVRPLLIRWIGTAGRLATDNVRRNPVRAALTAGALAAGLTMVIATPGLITAMLKGGLQIFGDVIKEDRIVQFDSVAMIASGEASVDNLLQLFIEAPPLDPELVVRLERLAADGVIELERMDVAPIPQAVAALPGYPGIFVDPEPFIRHDNFDFFEGDPETAIALMKRGRAMLMQPLAAERLGVHAGDTVRVQTPKGEVEFTVAGVGGIGWQMTAFPYADGEAYFGVGELPTLGVYVTPAHAARRDEVLRQIDEIVKDYPGNIAIDFSEGVKGFNVIIDQFTTLLNALLMMAVIVAALGVVNTMVINVAERKREIGMLRAVGATQRQVRLAVVAEAAVLGLLAAVVAAVFSVLMLLAFVVIGRPRHCVAASAPTGT